MKLASRCLQWGAFETCVFHAKGAKDATIAKRDSTSLSFSRIAFQEVAEKQRCFSFQFHRELLFDPTLATL
jgi:hypothetical protein